VTRRFARRLHARLRRLSLRGMHGRSRSPDEDARLGAIESAIADLAHRIADVESRVAALSEQAASDHKLLKMKTARTGEMSSRIAQRIAKIEQAVELLARCQDEEVFDEPRA
jgi:hypothetical protein